MHTEEETDSNYSITTTALQKLDQELQRQAQRLKCPITQHTIKNPSCLPRCGHMHCFEKKALQQWISINHHCPLKTHCATQGIEYQISDIKPNFLIKQTLESYQKKKEWKQKAILHKKSKQSKRFLDEMAQFFQKKGEKSAAQVVTNISKSSMTWGEPLLRLAIELVVVAGNQREAFNNGQQLL